MIGNKDGWTRLARNLKAEIDTDLTETYRGTASLPFEASGHSRIAVKIIDDRGIESLKIEEIRLMTRPTKAEAIKRLRKALDAIPKLKNLSADSPEFKKWRRNAQIAITHTFENESSHIRDFKNIDFFSERFFAGTSGFQTSYANGLESAAAVLESMIEEISEYWEDENQRPAPSETHKDEQINTDKVFVVHGRDDGTKQTIARFLETLGLEPLILHEQAN